MVVFKYQLSFLKTFVTCLLVRHCILSLDHAGACQSEIDAKMCAWVLREQIKCPRNR